MQTHKTETETKESKNNNKSKRYMCVGAIFLLSYKQQGLAHRRPLTHRFTDHCSQCSRQQWQRKVRPQRYFVSLLLCHYITSLMDFTEIMPFTTNLLDFLLQTL